MDTILLLVLVAMAGAGVAAGLIVLVFRRGARPAAEPGSDPMPLLEAHALRLDRLADAVNRQAGDASGLRSDLGRTREVIEALRAHADEQRRVAETGWDVVHRLEAVLIGGGPRGRSGENVLQDALSALPPEMVVRDFRVNGRVVEFALILPDGRRLPVDSKWTAARELVALQAAEEPSAREALARDIERCVANRAREVAAYLDASLTTPFAVACVPDAAFALCRKAHAEAFARHVVLVSYSTALPVLLALYALAARHGAAGDIAGSLADLERVVGEMEQILENKVARAAAMLQTATQDWRTQIGSARGALARGRGASALNDDGPAEDPAVRAIPG
jgi:DNA anti-recombination protein RmuC